MDDLKEGKLDGDPYTESVPDDEQIRDYPRVIDLIRGVAATGEPANSRQVNYLEDGIWEFKYGNKRLAFYDTDGRGNHVPKGRCTLADSPEPDSPYYWFPTFAEILRITNGWIKTGDRARRSDIDMAKQIRGEDLAHDRTQ